MFTAGPEFNTFSNVLHGTRNGLTIDAKWQDVPLGDTKSKGDISLTIAPTGEKITKNSASGGFGGNSWIKKCDQIAESKLPTDVILAESDTGIIPTPKGNNISIDWWCCLKCIRILKFLSINGIIRDI